MSRRKCISFLKCSILATEKAKVRSLDIGIKLNRKVCQYPVNALYTLETLSQR